MSMEPVADYLDRTAKNIPGLFTHALQVGATEIRYLQARRNTLEGELHSLKSEFSRARVRPLPAATLERLIAGVGLV